LITGASDGSLGLWDLRQDSPNGQISEAAGAYVDSLALCGADILLVHLGDGSLVLRRLPEGEVLLRTPPKAIRGWRRHSLCITPRGRLISRGFSTLDLWGSVDELIHDPVAGRRLRKGEPLAALPVRVDDFACIDDTSLLIQDGFRIARLDLSSGDVEDLQNVEKGTAFQRGLVLLGPDVAISWKSNGEIWRWDLPSLSCEQIETLPSGLPREIRRLDEQRILVATELSEEVYLLDLFPKDPPAPHRNFIVQEVPDPDDYPVVALMREKISADGGATMSKQEMLDFLRSRQGLGGEWTNARRMSWQDDGAGHGVQGKMDIQWNLAFYVVEGAARGLLPGSIRSWEGASLVESGGFHRINPRITLRDVCEHKIWAEVRNG
jgi:hypothetical protein